MTACTAMTEDGIIAPAMGKHSTEYRIYALFVRDSDGLRRYFYVGKTRRSIADRVREHRNRARHGHEDLYAHLRRLDRDTVAWEHEELRLCVDGEYEQDVERFEVVRLLRLGHDLCNMRYGDASHRADLARMRDDPTIRSACDVRRERLSAEKRDQVKARGRLRRKELAAILRDTGITSAQACPLLRGVLVRRLTRNGDISVERSVSLSDLVRYARDCRRWESLGRLQRDVEVRHPLHGLTRAR